MTPQKRATKKTTPAHPRKEAVAEEGAGEKDQAVADETTTRVDDAVSLVPPPVAPAAQPAVDVVGLGPCRVCGAPGEVKASFPWTADEPVFCRKDVPPQYRFLLSKS